MIRDKGFTLIEICASLAILGAMALFFATVYHSISIASARNAQDQDVNDAVAQLKTQFSEFEDFCAANFAGTALTAAMPNGDSVTVISRVDGAGNRVGDLFRVGSALRSGVVVEDIRLLPNSTLTNQYMVATLALRLRRPVGASGPSMERAIPIYAAVNNDRVVRCSAITGNTMILRDDLCRMQNGGFATYDAVGGYCIDDPRVRWVRGTTTSARCPAGYVISAHRDDPGATGVACVAAHRGIRVRARTYTNGETAGGGNVVAYVPVIDWTLHECQFAFPPSEDLSTIATHVRCVPSGARPL